MKRVVLDASAVMAFFEDRPGAEKVEELIGQAVEGKKDLLMSVVNWGELYYATWRAHGPEAAKRVMNAIAQLPIQIVDADMELTRLAAEFRAQHKLPYADCFVAAVAKLRKTLVLTADRDFVCVQKETQILWADGKGIDD